MDNINVKDLLEKYKDDPLIKFIDIVYLKATTAIYIALILNLVIFGVTLTLGGFNLISYYWSLIPGFFLTLLLGITHMLG